MGDELRYALHGCIKHVEKVVRLLVRWKSALGNM